MGTLETFTIIFYTTYFLKICIIRQVTLGITGCQLLRAPIGEATYHLDVGSFFPVGAAANMWGSVRPLNEYVIWV